MKGGAENRRKTITLGALGAFALSGVLYNFFALFGGSNTPPPAIAPVTNTPAPVRPGTASTASESARPAPGGAGAVPGVAAQRLASASTSLDPTLDQTAMLRTESLVYSGSGRNIFSATYVAPAIVVPKHVPPPRPGPPPGPVQPVYTGPPPPPPIPLKYFGTAQRGHGDRQAFLLSGDDVYLASTGDIVAKRFRIGQISSSGVQVTDLGNNNTQMLPLQQN